jgi:Protein of unknown function (DUF3105)
MAKKPRTPPPPRRVQAPKKRQAQRQGLDPARQRLILYGLAGSGIVALAVVLIVIFAGGKSGPAGNPAKVAATLRAAGCTMTTSEASPSAQHISSLSQTVTYSTYPPTSGKHYVQPAIWGNYTQEVDPRQAVHNLEHGGIVVWVGPDVSQAERREISDFYDESPNGLLVTPIANTAQGVKYPQHAAPDSKAYLTAWTAEIANGKVEIDKNVIATCPRFDKKAFEAFRDEFRGKGPERYPVSNLTPGT